MPGPGGKSVGRVSIRVVPDSTRFKADLKKALDRIEKSTVLNIPLAIETRNAELALKRFQKKWNGEQVKFDADVSTLGATAHLREFLRERILPVAVRLSNTSLAKAATILASLAGARVAGDLISNLSAKLQNLDRSLPKLTAIALGVGSIGAVAINAIGGVGALTVAVGRLAGAGGLIPAMLGGLTFGIGTFVTAFAGVGAALKASTVSVAGGSQSLKVSAMQLAQAQQAALDAQKALNQARVDAVRNLRDLSNSVIDAQLSQRQSTLDLAAAQDSYDKVVADPKATSTAREQAQITFEQAQQQLLEQTQRVQDLRNEKAAADQAGVDGAANVIQAQRQLAQTQLGLLQTQQAGTPAVNQYAAAMAKLTPAGREAVRTLLSLRGQLTAIRRVVQENFFTGFSASLLSLTTVMLPQLSNGMGRVATELGSTVQQTFAAIRSAISGGALEKFLTVFADSIRALNPAIKPFIQAFSTLSLVGATFLPKMSAGISDAAQRFNAFIDRAAASGELEQWIGNALTGFREVGHVLTGVGQIVGGLFRSVSGAGADPIAGLATALHNIADVINTPVFQTTLGTIFAGAAAGAAGIAASLGPIGDMFTALAPVLAIILTSSGQVVGQILGEIAAALSQPAFATGLSNFFAGIQVGLQAIAPSLPAIAAALGSLGTLAGALAAQLGPVLGAVLSALAPILTEVLTAVQPLLPILGGALVQVFQQLGPLVGQIITQLLPPLVGLFAALVPVVLQLVQAILPIVMQLLPPLVGYFNALMPALMPLVQTLLPLLVAVLQPVVSILAAFVPIATLIIQILVQLLIPVIQSLTGAFKFLTPGIQLAMTIIGALANILSTMLMGSVKMVTQLLRGDFAGAAKTVGDVFKTLGDIVSGAFSSVKKIVSDVINGIIDLVNGAIGGINDMAAGIKKITFGVVDIHLGKLPHVPSLAMGATVLPTPGGTLTRLAEAGRAEDVVDHGLMNQLIKRALGTGEGTSNSERPIVNHIYEAVSARATALQVSRMQAARFV